MRGPFAFSDSPGNTWLLPKRPRTPLTITRDLVGLIEAQAQVISPKRYQENVASGQKFKFKRPVENVANRQIEPLRAGDSEMLERCFARPDTEKLHPIEAKVDTVDPGAVNSAAKETRRISSSAKGASVSTWKREKDVRSSFDAPEVLGKTKAREPTITQQLSGDLRLLDNAVGAPPQGARKLYDCNDDYAAAVPTSASKAPDDMTPKRKHPSMWERPWRTPPPRRRSTNRNSTRMSLASVEKSVLANLVEPNKSQKKELNDSSPKAKLANKEETQAKGGGSGVGGANTAALRDTGGTGLNDANVNLWRMAAELKIPHDILKQAFDIFKEYAADESDVADKSHLTVANTAPVDVMKLCLTKDLFGKVLMMITGATRQDELPTEFFYETFATADKDGSEEIDFVEFAVWYAKHGFSEEVLLTKDQRLMRDVARKFAMPHSEVERFKAKFDEFDLDGSGEIDFSEFEKILVQLLKVPAHLELPASRLKQFWQETDVDGTGTINFEEFLEFYCKSFDAGNSEVSPLETFYRGLRPNTMRGSTRSIHSPHGTQSARQPVAEVRSRLTVPSFFPRMH